jgi:hypothetical protein
VDIVRGIEETDKLTTELMNIEIPEYKPSENHVKLVVRGKIEISCEHLHSHVYPIGVNVS